MILGAHQSAAGGIDTALDRLNSIGGNALQLFASSPRTWLQPQVSDNSKKQFLHKAHIYKIKFIFFHACYLINLADSELIGQKSVNQLTNELNLASGIGCTGSIVHTGTFRHTKNGKYDYTTVPKDKYKKLLKNLELILTNTPDNTSLILENSATRKIGSTMEELDKITKDIKSNRLKIALDTCHLHASGYDISTKKNLENFLNICEESFGVDNIEAFHLNDSKDEFKAFRDRHDNIGQGKVGLAVFRNLLNHKKLKDKPFIIETPGFDGKGPDKRNIDILKSLSQ